MQNSYLGGDIERDISSGTLKITKSRIDSNLNTIFLFCRRYLFQPELWQSLLDNLFQQNT